MFLFQSEDTSPTPRDRFRQLARPWVETYWESYLSSPYDYDNCYGGTLNPVDETAYGYDLGLLPVGGVDGAGAQVFNIAFGNENSQ